MKINPPAPATRKQLEKAREKAIEYLAALMLAKETIDKGFMPMDWRVIRKEVKNLYIKRACTAILIWGEE